ncbi:MAG: hypothetical protein DPW16_10165 [Chloroflexi bacterium]|nr:hypothetical protein [Chloroflexota bacterium]
MTKTQEAIRFIVSYCPHISSFDNYNDVGNVFAFLKQVALDIDESPETPVFQGRTKEHVAYAVDTVACWDFLSSPSVMAASYLVTRFEFYFRVLSGVLNEDGTWIGGRPPLSISSVIQVRKGRVSNVDISYKIMKLNTSTKVTTAFNQLDISLSPYWSPKIKDIGERIARMRLPTAHGALGDPSSEAIFYGLVTAIVFYNQS